VSSWRRAATARSIIDTDMRRPRVHKILRASNEKGVSSLIVGEAAVEDVIKSTDVPNLWILPCGPIPPNPAELLETDKFTALVKTLGERFDRLIFDSPPILAVTDAAVLSRVTDGTVMVVRAGRTPRDSVMRARRHIQAVNARIAGVVLNDVDLRNPHYTSYYHYYQYHYKYAEAPAAGAGSSARDKG
jgi:capsular exopolysaccharide synthesis family protein